MMSGGSEWRIRRMGIVMRRLRMKSRTIIKNNVSAPREIKLVEWKRLKGDNYIM